MALVVAPPKTEKIKNPGGVKAPSGPSVAARMTAEQRRSSGRSYTLRTRREASERGRSTPSRGGGRGPTSTPYDPLASPYKTQAQFEQGVAKIAKSQYQPELDTLGTEETGEQGLHQAREGENAATYKTYSEQAQAAFDRAKAAMADIASRQRSATTEGQATLQAALSNTGVSGLSGVPNPKDFAQEASGLGTATGEALAGQQSGELAERAGGMLVPGVGRAEAQAKEQLRSSGQLGKIAGERRKVTANIPNILAKTRSDLSKQETERATNALQGRIAQGKLGLEAKTQAQSNATQNRQITSARDIAREGNYIKLKEANAANGFKWEELDLQRKDLSHKAAAEGNAKKKAEAEAAGKRFDHGLEVMDGYFKGVKANAWPAGTKLESATGKPPQAELEKNKWTHEERADAMTLYKILTEQANLPALEAFKLMKSSGNGYVELFAREHEAIYRAALRGGAHGVTGSVNAGVKRVPAPAKKK